MRKAKHVDESKRLLKDITAAVNEAMDRIILSTHNDVLGFCPQCNVKSPCKTYQDAKERLNG